MSEQIREQVSAFLDGELPSSETELLLKRLTRDAELRESFGRYALIGEALRGGSPGLLTRGFAARVNLAIDGEPAPAVANLPATARGARWWRPFAGAAVAAGVAAVAVVALQERSVAPTVMPTVAANVQSMPALAQNLASPAQVPAAASTSQEAISYTVPAPSQSPRSGVLPARLTNYVFAHSRYSSGLDLRGVMADMLIESEEQPPAVKEAVSHAP
ncbi:MAG TPA: sigma-E factor negative regulatory protein [Steroidobacteraceae bacterium]|jgi:sigma-E factor negative regulatory protein RseA|nr:sigma-E factor negative regulatory protein [Steroidobacteraceae bacterium]